MRKASGRIGETRLSKTADRGLKVYSTAALAAGASLLALAELARGEVVVTRKTITIPENPQNSFPAGVDFNHDGINELSAGVFYSAYPISDRSLSIFLPNQGAVAMVASQNGYPLAMARGAKIGPSAHFSTRNRVEFVNGRDSSSGTYTRTLKGNWGGLPPTVILASNF